MSSQVSLAYANHAFDLILCSFDKLGAHMAPSFILFAALQRILMAIPVVVYMAFTRLVH